MTLVKNSNANISNIFDELFNNFPTHWGRDMQYGIAIPPANIHETHDGVLAP